MKIKTSEATPLQIDWAVAKCEGYFSTEGQKPAYWGSSAGAGHFISMRNAEGHGVHWTHPTTDWGEGGPIIEREFIECTVMPCGHSSITFDTWLATIAVVDADMVECSGPTLLIAAMRAFVASKLGEEVEVPDELE